MSVMSTNSLSIWAYIPLVTPVPDVSRSWVAVAVTAPFKVVDVNAMMVSSAYAATRQANS
jgi:hypothetical protein